MTSSLHKIWLLLKHGIKILKYGLTENAGHEIAAHDKYGMKIDYITLECAFLLNFKSFVYKGEYFNVQKN